MGRGALHEGETFADVLDPVLFVIKEKRSKFVNIFKNIYILLIILKNVLYDI